MSTSTVIYTPNPDQILAKAATLAEAMQVQVSDRTPAPRSLRYNSERRPLNVEERVQGSPNTAAHSQKSTQFVAHRTKRSNTTATINTLEPPPAPGLERASKLPTGERENNFLGSGLLRSISSEAWPLRKSSDEPRPFDGSPPGAREDALPKLTHEDILVPSAAREHAITETPSPLPAAPRLRESTFIPDHRKLKYAHPESGKLKLRSFHNIPLRGASHTSTPLAPPPLPVPSIAAKAATQGLSLPAESTIFPLRDSAKSSTTYVSSINDVSATDRSSTVTSRTSASELLSPYGPPRSNSVEEEISVEDYIALYAQGFEDDPPPHEPLPPPVPNKPAVSSPLSPRREEKVPPVPRISIPHSSTQPFPSLGERPPATSVEVEPPERSPGAPVFPKPSAIQRPSPPSALADVPHLPLPPKPPFASAESPVTSVHLFAGDTPADGADLSFLEPPPDPDVDRYGFKKHNQYISLDEYEAWDEQYVQYLNRRRHKWNDLMRQHGLNAGNPTEFPPRSDKVKRFIRKGIPPEWRGAAWFWYANGPARVAANSGLYERLLKRCDDYAQLGDSDREHIERDLYRTFPDNHKFKRLPDDPNATRPGSYASTAAASGASRFSSALTVNYERPLIGALRRVLRAFAVHQPQIGYCQSLNFLAGLLLLLLNGDEEKAFHLLCILTTEHLPGTHGLALEGANVDIGVLMSTLKDREPALWAKLDDRADSTSSPISPSKSKQLPTVSLATTSWFMSCFVGSLPVEACVRVWDCLFYEGSKTLFRIALGIFRLGAEEIKAIRDPMEIFQVVQTLPRKMVDANTLMETSFGKTLEGRGLLSSGTVEKRREERRGFYQKQRREREGVGRNGLLREKSGSDTTRNAGEEDTEVRRSHSASTATELTVVSSKEDAIEGKRRPSVSRGTSFRKLAGLKSRKKTPPMPELPR